MQITKKGFILITDYISKIKSIANNLATFGASLTDEDLILNGLDDVRAKYDLVVVINVLARP